MLTCFVIQPFDGGAFDKRYEDIYAPAILAAGLEPYRVDRDPSVAIPIDQIESGIRSAAACLVDITLDNPNVWFELGYALASQKDVVLVCSKERTTHFPFDVQHRTIIKYSNDAPRDFECLSGAITERLKSLLSKEAFLEGLASSSPVRDVAGLTQYEIVAVAAIAERMDAPYDGVPVCDIRQDMERAGFTRIATTLALVGLQNKRYVDVQAPPDGSFPGQYTPYSLTDSGMEWLLANKSQFLLQIPATDDDELFADPFTEPAADSSAEDFADPFA